MTNIEILIAIVGIVKINKIKKKLRSSLFHFIARSKVTHFFINEISYAYLSLPSYKTWYIFIELCRVT